MRVDRHRLRWRVAHVRDVLHHWLHERKKVLYFPPILRLLYAQLVILCLQAGAALALLTEVYVAVTQRLLQIGDLLHPLA